MGVKAAIVGAQEEFLAARDFLLTHRDDYTAACDGFRWPVGQSFNWALDYFDRIAAGNDHAALHVVQPDGAHARLTYEELSQRSARTANWLRALGARRGQRLLIMLPNIVPLWEVMLGAMKLGAVIIPATPLLDGEDLKDRLERGRADVVVTTMTQVDKFESVAHRCVRIVVDGKAPGWIDYSEAMSASAQFSADRATLADDPLLIYFTSGTTAKPKLVLHTHRSYPVGHLSTMYWLGLRKGDIHWNISSPGWAKHAWSNVFAPWNAQACVYTFNFERFQPAAVLDRIVADGVTTLCAPPTVWRHLVQEDLKRWRVQLRELASAGEPLNAEIIDRVRAAWGLTIRDGYGQTETTAQIGNSPNQAVLAGSMGRPLPGYEVRLLDESGREADQGEIALVLASRPAGLMAGYLTSADQRPCKDTAQYYRTGDIARRTAGGQLIFIGRADDVFKSSDYRVSPFELESAIIEHDAVAEVAVVPSPEPTRLTVPKAFIALVAGRAADRRTALEIFIHSRQVLPPFKRIRRLEFATLPKTVSGKIRRAELRAAEAQLRRGKGRNPLEFWEEDFPELRERQ